MTDPLADSEPKEAFPYKPPSAEQRKRYSELFEPNLVLKKRVLKRFFDIIVGGLIFLFVSIPFLSVLYVAYKIEGILDKKSRGNVFYYYNAVSRGKIIKKFKIRVIQRSFIDLELEKRHDWRAHKAEWNQSARTRVGQFAKSYYLDELPQFLSVVIGNMSLVGPRPLSTLHYDRDLEQGNVTRTLLTGGVLGLGHIRKGTAQMGDPEFELEYAEMYKNASTFKLLMLDIWIIKMGIRLMLKGQGL